MSYQPGELVFVSQILVDGSANYNPHTISGATPLVSGMSVWNTEPGPTLGHSFAIVIADEGYDRYRVEVDHQYRKVQYIVYAYQLSKVTT